MNPEETKVKDFFKKLKKLNTNSWASWFVVGLCLMFLVIGCVAPVQAYLEGKDDAGFLMIVIVSLVAPLTAYMRINSLTLYTEGQKGREILDILKYYPINKKEIKKLKIICMTKFMAKVLPICMLAQIPATLYDYGKLSIINFLYIFIAVFAWPVVLNVIMIILEK